MLSRDRARREAAWDTLEKEFETNARVEGVTGVDAPDGPDRVEPPDVLEHVPVVRPRHRP